MGHKQLYKKVIVQQVFGLYDTLQALTKSIIPDLTPKVHL